jgi:mannose-1-phosphate guanylyltransferase/mannose-6-phosphate isomerase
MKNCSGAFTDVIILAGGIGERLWPLSTKEHPKQFIPTERGSFFQTALRRAALLKPTHGIFVVTRAAFKDIAVSQCASAKKLLTKKQFEFMRDKLTILLEPAPRHTAAAVQFALSFIEKEGTSTGKSILVLTSDHVIETDGQFLSSCVRAAGSVAEDYFVCFGIKPVFPATGFGYFESGKEIEPSVREILSFREKPDEKTAKAFIAHGNYWWNSGMFAFDGRFYRDEIKKYVPGLYEPFAPLLKTSPRVEYCGDFRFVRQWRGLAGVYGRTEAVSIDRAIAEKTDRRRCVVAEFDWDDIGSWDAFSARMPSDKDRAVMVESENCSVYSDVPVALCGVSSLIVAVKDGRVLVMKKGKSSLIREAARSAERLF